MFIDGRDVTTLPLASLRAQIGYAPQEAFLFSTTIADNIAMGYGGGTAIPAARAQELERVGRPMAAAADLRRRAARHGRGDGRRARRATSRRCPRGSRRSSASAASRCRAASASASRSRARSPSAPRLLVLDDSLSSVDAETERAILKHLRDVMHGRTAVLISHRVAAIKDADQIIVLDQGKVVARGTHERAARAGRRCTASSTARSSTPRSRARRRR